jgi:hypothetical protein
MAGFETLAKSLVEIWNLLKSQAFDKNTSYTGIQRTMISEFALAVKSTFEPPITTCILTTG